VKNIKNTTVYFSEPALAQIIASGLEAFVVPHEVELSHWTGIETFMTLWGSETNTGDNHCLNVEFAITSTSAERGYNTVHPSQKTLDLKQDLITAYFPQYQMIGDLHTHPYIRNRSKNISASVIRKERLFSLSPTDLDSCLRNPLQNFSDGFYISAVLTITNLEKENSVKDGPLESNTIEFSLNNYKCWLSCTIFQYVDITKLTSTELKILKESPHCFEEGLLMVADENINLHAPSLLFMLEHQKFGVVKGKKKLKHIKAD